MQQACQYLSVNLINPHNLKEERPTGTPQRSKKDMYLQNLDYRIFFFWSRNKGVFHRYFNCHFIFGLLQENKK